ncbi:MAG TPA: hypothetical protein VJL36_01925 [Candidatus Paceibacterota bacterium]
MSNWGASRQLIFFLVILLIILAAAGAAGWYFWPRPSCADGRQNQNERGPDCGGVCAAVCADEVQAVQVKWARVLTLVPPPASQSPGVYDVAALVENPNPNLTLLNWPYNLRIVDAANLFITRLTGTLTLSPNEKFLIFETNINVGRRIPARAFLDSAGPPRWRRSLDQDKLAVAITDRQFTPAPPLLKAQLTNSSLVSYRDLKIAAVLSDGEQNAIAASVTAVGELAAGETKEISFSWPRPLTSEPVLIDFYPHVALDDSRH